MDGESVLRLVLQGRVQALVIGRAKEEELVWSRLPYDSVFSAKIGGEDGGSLDEVSQEGKCCLFGRLMHNTLLVDTLFRPDVSM